MFLASLQPGTKVAQAGEALNGNKSAQLVLVLLRSAAHSNWQVPAGCLVSVLRGAGKAYHICWVSSGTDSARYCWEPREVSGVKPTCGAQHTSACSASAEPIAASRVQGLQLGAP